MEQMTAGQLAEITGGKLLQGNPDTPVAHISIDSRNVDRDTLFVPLKGERVDAHRFLADTAAGRAGCVLSCEEITPSGDAAWIQVNSTYEALIKIGVTWRNRMDELKVVAVTGSVGKTTTREMVATALGAAYRTFKTTKNYNSDIGVPIMLAELSKADQMAVLELGMSDFGEMEKIAGMASPDIAVITNIGVAHIAQLKTRENICQEKLSVTKGMKPGSLLILNGDDDLLSKVDSSIGHEILFYGFGEHNDYRAQNVVFTENKTVFEAVCPGGTVTVSLPVTGNHMVMNALAALAAANHFGVDAKAAAEALSEFQAFKGRQQIYSIRDFRVIDDTYNASPDSMRAALGVLTSLSCSGKRIAVLSDMLELGEQELTFHRQVGEFAGSLPLDLLVCVGTRAREYGVGAAERSGKLAESKSVKMASDGADSGLSARPDEMKIRYFDSNREAADFLKTAVSAGDLLLFKGSNSTHVGEIITFLKEECE